jgi:basic amino acid/polyamine antiporter, APA family
MSVPSHPSREGSGAVAEPGLRRVMGPKLLLFFVLGDVLGAGVYAVTGVVAGHVGGMAWLPFVLAFSVAALTALSYVELVTRFPRAAGAALYTHEAFRIHFVTFLVAFAVVSAGITSAATAAKLLAANLLAGLDTLSPVPLPTGDTAALVTALSFMLLLAVVNLRGVGESVKFNVVLTVVEISALAIVIGIGLYATGTGAGDISRVLDFRTEGDTSWFVAVTLGTAVAFFAMVGFEDSVNMVEETRDPQRVFPRVMFLGLGIAAAVYVLVAVAVVTVLSPEAMETASQSDEGVLLAAVREGVPDFPVSSIFPFLTVFAVANTALINMLMASRMVYGMAHQRVLPRSLGRVLPGRRSPWSAIAFTTVLALALIAAVTGLAERTVAALAGTTGLLLLLVFAVVNAAVIVLRRRPVDARADQPDGRPRHFRAPAWSPALGVVTCLFLAGPWARAPEDWIQYRIAAALVGLGALLWLLTRLGSRTDDRGDGWDGFA